VGSYAFPQGDFGLDPDQGLEALGSIIEEHEGGIAHLIAAGKCQPLRSREIGHDKGDLRTKFGAERIDDALELSAVRSAR
jgi:hypothetical protein